MRNKCILLKTRRLGYKKKEEKKRNYFSLPPFSIPIKLNRDFVFRPKKSFAILIHQPPCSFNFRWLQGKPGQVYARMVPVAHLSLTAFFIPQRHLVGNIFWLQFFSLDSPKQGGCFPWAPVPSRRQDYHHAPTF
ncbi:hypothetical protein CEXT_363781 [Caerostris extrusa]|uniref:Uncharacterized protein n=1 Tax=Caerostris extrusa TaxID=172846 RepID=A0AAV4QKL9_CAEEX|nr:hypothetical protein CEXT_363781 [Caerostris extrusa]